MHLKLSSAISIVSALLNVANSIRRNTKSKGKRMQLVLGHGI